MEVRTTRPTRTVPRDADMRKRLKSHVDTLPLLPAVVSKLMALDRSAPEYFQQVRALIEADPNYTARILAAANSAKEAPRSRITSVRRALTRLGTSKASDLIVAMAMSRVFAPRDQWEKSLWRYSLQVALALRALVQASPRADIRTDEAYTAGLLHDVGRFVLFMENPKALRKIDDQQGNSPRQSIRLEQEAYGMSHAELGALACEHWRLPELLVGAVRRHHDSNVHPERGEIDTLVAAIHFADHAMFPSARPGSSGYEDADLETIERELIPKLPAFFDFDAASLQVVLQSAARESDEMCALIGLD